MQLLISYQIMEGLDNQIPHLQDKHCMTFRLPTKFPKHQEQERKGH